MLTQIQTDHKYILAQNEFPLSVSHADLEGLSILNLLSGSRSAL